MNGLFSIPTGNSERGERAPLLSVAEFVRRYMATARDPKPLHNASAPPYFFDNRVKVIVVVNHIFFFFTTVTTPAPLWPVCFTQWRVLFGGRSFFCLEGAAVRRPVLVLE